ncbi:hypothetical protein N836_09425 [Leptolyngbya sp. Heron Island J]|nr:hypothetical protein N836_09425 [Leptolyngbya sp. Heron Island J]
MQWSAQHYKSLGHAIQSPQNPLANNECDHTTVIADTNQEKLMAV